MTVAAKKVYMSRWKVTLYDPLWQVSLAVRH